MPLLWVPLILLASWAQAQGQNRPSINGWPENATDVAADKNLANARRAWQFAPYSSRHNAADLHILGLPRVARPFAPVFRMPDPGADTVSVAERTDAAISVGYGMQRSEMISGSVASIDMAAIRRSTSATLEGALQGAAAGVAVTSSGAPGETPEVRIRGIVSFGNNDPLYVIDGVPVDHILDFNVREFASVQVLKGGAASAIYGTRASRGVVLITTRRGERATGLHVDYEGSAGVANIHRRWEVLGREDYQDLVNEMLERAGTDLLPANDPTSAAYISDVDTDWQNEALEPGMMMRHDLAISGGSDASRYSFTAGYLGQEGHMKGPGPYYGRYSVRINSDHVMGRLSFGEAAYFANSHTIRQESLHEISLINNMIKAIPTVRVYDESRLGGYGGPDPGIDRAITLNVVGVNNIVQSQDNANRFLGNLWGRFDLLEGLSYKLNFGYDMRQSEDFLFVPQFDMGYFFIEFIGRLTQLERRRETTLLEHTLRYARSFRGHDFEVLAGSTQEESNYEHVGGYSEGYANSEFRTLEAATEGNSPLHYRSDNTLRSLLARVFYAYRGRFLLAASVRRDGSSRFSPEHRHGVFPAVSLGYRLADPSLLKLPFVDAVKVRGSYGITGNHDVGDYTASALVNTFALYSFADRPAPGATQVTLANEDLRWERTEHWDVGLDAELLDSRVLLTADYFRKKSTDILLAVPVPQTTGSVSNPAVNAGSVLNSGLEFTLTYRNKGSAAFGYDIAANLTTWNNEVLSLGERQAIWGRASKTCARGDAGCAGGGEIGQIYGWVTDGLFQAQHEVNSHAFQRAGTAPGDIRFKDLNGDGFIKQDDRAFLGSAIPDFYYGFSAGLRYRQLDLTMFMQGTYGNRIFHLQRSILENMGRFNNHSTAVLDRWSPDNTDTDMPRAFFRDPNGNSRISDRFVEDGSYLRIQDVTVGFTLPSRLSTRIGASRARLYVSGHNVLTLTRYSGLDPDLGDDGDEVDNDALFSRGYDSGAWPHPRIFRAGVQLRF